MKRFHVWLRPLGAACRLRVEGKENAIWLRFQLSKSMGSTSVEMICQEDVAGNCTLMVHQNANTTRRKLEELLDSIPELVLMGQPT